MKSKERFLKVKEEADSEKGCYWYLNPEQEQFQESLENALETSDKLENFVGIVYFKLQDGEEPPAVSVLFSDEDKRYSSELYYIDLEKQSCVQFSKYHNSDLFNAKKRTTPIGSKAVLPLPPPPIHNLIVFIEEDYEPASVFTTKAEKKRKNMSKKIIKSSRSLDTDYVDSKKSREKKTGEIEFGGLAMAYPTPAEVQDSDGFDDTSSSFGDDQFYSDSSPHRTPRRGSNLSLKNQPSTQTSLLSYFPVSSCNNDKYEVNENNDDSDTMNSIHEDKFDTFNNNSTQDISEGIDLFNEDENDCYSKSGYSLLFDKEPMSGYSIPIINLSFLDIDRLMADPSIPIDSETSFYWNL